jgi:putative hydrolase of the HAD superfamily
MIRAVIFDWGGVICEDPGPGFIRVCSAQLGLNPQILAPVLAQHLPSFMRGLPEAEFWNVIANDLQIEPPQEPLWEKALATVYVPKPETIICAQELAQRGILLGLLTNTEPPSKHFHLSQGYDFFSARVFSSDEGILKPQPEIYHLIAQRLGLAPEQCLMVDDRAENIAGASNVGIPGHLFTSSAHFRETLVQMGLLLA